MIFFCPSEAPLKSCIKPSFSICVSKLNADKLHPFDTIPLFYLHFIIKRHQSEVEIICALSRRFQPRNFKKSVSENPFKALSSSIFLFGQFPSIVVAMSIFSCFSLAKRPTLFCEQKINKCSDDGFSSNVSFSPPTSRSSWLNLCSEFYSFP